MSSIPSNGYREVMAGSNVYTGSNLYGSICPQTPIPPATPPDLVNKLYVDSIVGPPSGVGLSQVLTVGNSATGQDILSVNNMTVQNIALNSAGGFTTITPIQIATTTYNSTCVFEGGSGISQLATPTPSDLNINNQGIGYDITINTSNNAPKGQFAVNCPMVPSSIRDSASSLGNAGQVLTSLGTGAPYGSFNPTNLLWQNPVPTATPNINTVLNAGSNAGGLPISNLSSVGITQTIAGGVLAPLLVLENTNATGSVAREIFKNDANPVVAGDVLFNQSVYGIDSGLAKQEYTRISHTIRDGAAGVEDGSIEFGAFVNGGFANFLQINGNENEMNALKPIDMTGNNIRSSVGSTTITTVLSSGLGNITATAKGDITLETGTATGTGNVLINTVGAVGTGNITATSKGAIALTAAVNNDITLQTDGGAGQILLQNGTFGSTQLVEINTGGVNLTTLGTGDITLLSADKIKIQSTNGAAGDAISIQGNGGIDIVTTAFGDIDVLAEDQLLLRGKAGATFEVNFAGGADMNINSTRNINIAANSVNSAGNRLNISTGTNGGIAFTGAALQSATAGASASTHLVITLNGVPYKIALLNP